jgi:hypothetical protein
LHEGLDTMQLLRYLKDKAWFPKSGGLYSSAIDFVSNSSNPKISVDDFIDILNKVLDDHGFDKYKIKILKWYLNQSY